MSNPMPPEYAGRLDKVSQTLRDRNLDGLLILGPANRRYLSGFTAADGAIGESSGAVLVMRDRAVLLVSPLYVEQARQESVLPEPVVLKGRSAKRLPELLKEWGVRRLGFERDYTLYGYYEDLKEDLEEGSELVPLANVVEDLRVVKGPDEQQAMRDAARIADEAFSRVTAVLRPGVTERQVARTLDEAILELGADAPAFETIVAAGANSASPHHEPGETVINAGDPVVIDMGARYRGYCSDMTRSFCVHEADDRYKELHDLVLRAHLGAEEAIRAGIAGKDADAIARDLLTEAGYGEEFTHSLGHGVGLDVHERPRLGKDSEDTIEPGMAVTIEPGIYISGWGGIRIEDTVIVADGSHEVLNHSAKEAVL